MKLTECYRCGVEFRIKDHTYIVPATATWKIFCEKCAHLYQCYLCGDVFDTIKEWEEHIRRNHRRVN